MILVYFALLALLLIGTRIDLSAFNERYLSRDTTLAIKGFFVILVFCRHFKQYVTLSDNIIDRMFLYVDRVLGQLIVVMFLFYSGYGIIVQTMKKPEKYTRCFLKHRFIPTWVNFAICICFFIIVDIALGLIKNYSLWQIILAFTGWVSIGNSTWFMFDTFVFYLLFYVSYRLVKPAKIQEGLLIFSIFSVVFAMILFVTKKSTWWNTIFCLPLGMWYGYYRVEIEFKLRNNILYDLIFDRIKLLISKRQILRV